MIYSERVKQPGGKRKREVLVVTGVSNVIRPSPTVIDCFNFQYRIAYQISSEFPKEFQE
jgi:hypothetical protein